MTRAEALKILGLEEGFTEDDLDAAFKKAAKQHHPDKGGDSEKFAQAADAKSRLGPDYVKQRAEDYQNSMNYLVDATIREATNELILFRERRQESVEKIRRMRKYGAASIPFGIQEELIGTNDPITLSAIMPIIVQKLDDDAKDFSKAIEAAEKKMNILKGMREDCENEPDTDITRRYRDGLSKRIGDEQDNIKNLTDVRQATKQVKELFEQQRKQSEKKIAQYMLDHH